MFFKEYDFSSYNMRYRKSWTIFRDKKTQEEICMFVADMCEERGWFLAPSTHLRGTWYGWNAVEPKYHPIASGFYEGSVNPLNIVALSKRLTKSYYVGYNDDTHFTKIYGAEGRFASDRPNLLKHVTPDIPKALSKGGVLSRKLVLHCNTLYYLSRPVGLQKGSNFVVDLWVKSEIEDCLRGHGCSIRL